MKRLTLWIFIPLTIILLGLIGSHITPVQGQSSKQNTQAFMRMKLFYSQGIMEGLVLEDYRLIIQNANNLASMTGSNLWTAVRNDDYVKSTRRYEDRASDLVKAALKSDLKASTKNFNKLTQSCVDCHRQFRLSQRSVK